MGVFPGIAVHQPSNSQIRDISEARRADAVDPILVQERVQLRDHTDHRDVVHSLFTDVQRAVEVVPVVKVADSLTSRRLPDEVPREKEQPLPKVEGHAHLAVSTTRKLVLEPPA